MYPSEVTKKDVKEAIAEFDEIGRDAFLQKYGFGKSRGYFLKFNGKKYDSKAIIGAAHGFAFPKDGPLTPYDFGGGEGRVIPILEKLGFKHEGPARNPDWTRDELIVALDFYIKNRLKIPGKTSIQIKQLSKTISQIAIRVGARQSETLRNPAGVYMKLMNLRAHDPDYTSEGKKGLDRGNKDEKFIWQQFGDDHDRLSKVADAICAGLTEDIDFAVDPDVDDDEQDAPEGRVLTKQHRVRERDSKITKRKKKQFLSQHGRLFCEACEFDFAEVYGERGAEFIECHHTKPVSQMKAGDKTKMSDLVLLCSNCHRMVHRRAPWLSMDALRRVLSA